MLESRHRWTRTVAYGVVDRRIHPNLGVVARTSGRRLDVEGNRVATYLVAVGMENIGRRVAGKLGSRRRWKDL